MSTFRGDRINTIGSFITGKGMTRASVQILEKAAVKKENGCRF